MCLTEFAIFLCFHSVRMILLFLCHVVIALLAFCTCQCNLNSHDLPPPLLFFRHKKKTTSIAVSLYHTFSNSSRVFYSFFTETSTRYLTIRFFLLVIFFLDNKTDKCYNKKRNIILRWNEVLLLGKGAPAYAIT